MDCEQIWVYGSLLEGFFNYEKALLGKVVSRNIARVKGTLFHQSKKGYPALIPGDGWVYGELLQLDDFSGLLPVIDGIEDFYGPGDARNEYERILTPVCFDGHESGTEAYVYWYGRDDLGSPENPVQLIPDGDWRVFMARQSGERVSAS
jgi:gamma-glutamylcyclotransferase (GGCT)/AIG2-like uncharacterized protein YtfP